MQTTSGYAGGGIIPPAGEWEFRGNQFFHPKTGSSLQVPISYCKDLRGCGDKEYRNVSSVVTLNYLDECIPRLNGVLSVSGLFYQSATVDQQDNMWEFIQLGAEQLPGGALSQTLANQAATVCG
jgi:hypothetical protein